MENYSLPRRIWRIVYPALIFIGIQVVFVVFIGVCLGVAFVVQSALSGASAFDETAVFETLTRFMNENAMALLLVTNIASLAVFLPMWLVTRKRNEPHGNSSPAKICLLVAGFFAGFNIVQMCIFGLTDIMRFFPSYSEVAETLVSGSTLMQVLAVGLVAPVVEELVFRGILINRMKWLPVWVAVFIQALIFSLVHMNLFQSLYAFLAGILLGVTYVKYRSIVMAIIGHVAFNLVSVLLGEYLTDELAIVAIVLSPVVMVVCAVFLIKSKGAVRKNMAPAETMVNNID